MSSEDPRVIEARAEHQASEAARAAAREAAKSAGHEHRQKRDQLVRDLRASDPDYWSHSVLAKAIGCSSELIAHILRKPSPS